MALIDGLVSGLDTTAIINQLLAVERKPIDDINARILQGDRRASALKSVQQSLDGLRLSAQALSRSSAYNATKVTSSAADRVAATAVVGTPPDHIAVRVQQLAGAHQLATAASVGDTTALTGVGRLVVASGLAGLGATAITPDSGATAGIYDLNITAAGVGQVRIALGSSEVTVATNATSATVGGVTLTFGASITAGTAKVQIIATDAATTVSSLAATLSTAGSPARAQLVNFASGATVDRRLALTSRGTGAAQSLLVGVNGMDAPIAAAFTTMTTIAAAKDARIEIGDTGIVVTRSSNTVSDLYDGVTLTLKQADPTVTVNLDVDKDVDDLTAKVKAWVDTMNATLTSIDTQSAYDATTKTGGPLMGDSAVRAVRAQLMSALTTVSNSGSLRALPQIGITIARSGRLQLDETMLRAAVTDQTSAVADLLGRSAAVSTANASFVSGTDATVAGTYAIDITTASAPAALSGAVFAALASSETLTIRLGTASATVTLAAGATPTDVVSAINAALNAARVSARASVAAGALRVESVDHGSAATLGITSSAVGADTTGLGVTAGVERTATGIDVAGTIGGQAATGRGQLLSATVGAPKGLTVRVGAGVVGAAGTVTYGGGVTGAVSNLLGSTGLATVTLADSINSVGAKKAAYNDQIERIQDRLTRTEQRLRRQFTQLETSLALLRSQGSRLSAIIGSSSSNNQSS
ncbi:MAG: flagellar filament capping protein FliD [Acidimicrobiales bacterium]